MAENTIIVEIVADGDEVRTSISAGDQAWDKKYPVIELATSEAEELCLIPTGMKQHLDGSHRMPSQPHGGYKDKVVDLDLEELIEELIARGFRQNRS